MDARELLELAEEFDKFGGMSLPLAAWEFALTPLDIAEIWTALITDGLLEPAGIDRPSGELLYRITPAGRALLTQ